MGCLIILVHPNNESTHPSPNLLDLILQASVRSTSWSLNHNVQLRGCVVTYPFEVADLPTNETRVVATGGLPKQTLLDWLITKARHVDRHPKDGQLCVQYPANPTKREPHHDRQSLFFDAKAIPKNHPK